MISLVFPTRCRQDVFTDTIKHLVDNCANTNNFEIIIKIDEDDDIEFYIEALSSLKYKVIQAPRGRGYLDIIYQANIAITMACGDYIWSFGDDLIIHSKNWDEVITTTGQQQKEVFSNGIFFMYALNPERRKSMMGFPIVPRAFVDRLGFFFKDEHGDSFIATIANYMNRGIILHDLIMFHSRECRWGGHTREEITELTKDHRPFNKQDAIEIADRYLK